MPDNVCLNLILQVGDTGPCVRYLQGLLRERSGFSGAVDGVMGEGTCLALKRFQQQRGLEPTGKTEPVTWEMLTSHGVPATPPPRQRCRLLRQGVEGPDVALLQERLEQLGHTPGEVDGIFGLTTEQAVLSWQKTVDLPANGVIGRRAWGKLGVNCIEFDHAGPNELAPTLYLGDQGRSVVLLQALLLSAGLDPGAIDGVYGSLTAAAVGAMQRASGLPVTLRADKAVWSALGLPIDTGLGDHCPTASLRYGSRGGQVRDLQVRLLEVGFDPGELDGIFGHQVKDAVIRLQTALELPPTGKMGRAEWQALGVADNGTESPGQELGHTMYPGDCGHIVEVLQRQLHSIGYDPGPVDGNYGPLTEAAVLLLQRSEGLPLTGVVDEMTWNVLTYQN